MKFPKEYEVKVDLKKVNWEVMKTWIATRVTELLGAEDEVLIGYVYEQLEHKDVRSIHPCALEPYPMGELPTECSLTVIPAAEVLQKQISAAVHDLSCISSALKTFEEVLSTEKKMQHEASL